MSIQDTIKNSVLEGFVSDISTTKIVVTLIFSLIIAGNKTEDIALNKSSDYKNYKERKLPKSQSQEEKLPELKSFKD